MSLERSYKGVSLPLFVVVGVAYLLLSACASSLPYKVEDQPVCNQLLVDAWSRQSERDHHFTEVIRGHVEFRNCLVERKVLPKDVSWGAGYHKREPLFHERVLRYFDLENYDLEGFELYDDGLRSATLRRLVSDEFRDKAPELSRRLLVNIVAREVDSYIMSEFKSFKNYERMKPSWDFHSSMTREYWADLGRGYRKKPVRKDSTFCEIVEALSEKERLKELSKYDPLDAASDWEDCLD